MEFFETCIKARICLVENKQKGQRLEYLSIMQVAGGNRSVSILSFGPTMGIYISL